MPKSLNINDIVRINFPGDAYHNYLATIFQKNRFMYGYKVQLPNGEFRFYDDIRLTLVKSYEQLQTPTYEQVLRIYTIIMENDLYLRDQPVDTAIKTILDKF